MNSLENKYISTETVIINMRGYRFEITGDHIIRYGMKEQDNKAFRTAVNYEDLMALKKVLKK